MLKSTLLSIYSVVNSDQRNVARRLQGVSLHQSGSARSENMGAGRRFAFGSFARSSLAESCRAGFDSFAPAISLPGRLTEKGLLTGYVARTSYHTYSYDQPNAEN